MNMEKARPVLLSVAVIDHQSHDELLVAYAGLEEGEFLYLIETRDISDYQEPSAYYKVAIRDIPHYDFSDDWNTMYPKHLPRPASIDVELMPRVKVAAKFMKKQYAQF